MRTTAPLTMRVAGATAPLTKAVLAMAVPLTIAVLAPFACATRAAAAAGPPGSNGAEEQLSNEVTFTAWAHPQLPGAIYAGPDPHSRRVAPVRLWTEDGFPEVYLLLSGFVDAAGREWTKVRIPGRPNGRTGWMLSELLGSFHHTRWRLLVNRARRTVKVYYNGRLRRVFPVGVGKPSTPTPPGRFWLRERFKLSRGSPYWPYALGTSDYSTLSEWPGGGVVGIHGDFGEPWQIPGDPSHGCIRMHDPDIGWLAPRVTLGTPVDIV